MEPPNLVPPIVRQYPVENFVVGGKIFFGVPVD